MNAIAQSLYGGTMPTPAPEPQAQPTAAQAEPAAFDAGAAADALYRNPADALDPATGLDRVYAPVQRDIAAASVEQLGMEPDEAKASAAEWATIFRQHDVPTADAGMLASVAAGVVSGAVPVDPVAWRTEARAAVASEFGDNAPAVMQAAQRLVASEPKLAAWLESTGLGDHPAVVRVVSQRAWAAKKAGRLG